MDVTALTIRYLIAPSIDSVRWTAAKRGLKTPVALLKGPQWRVGGLVNKAALGGSSWCGLAERVKLNSGHKYTGREEACGSVPYHIAV